MKIVPSLIIVAIITLFASCSFEIDKQNQYQLPGLISPVSVYTDSYGIPHIEAKNQTDAAYALGFVMASDRLFQMDLLRRIGNGQLSELFGKKMIEKDIFLRKLGLRRYADRNWQRIEKEGLPPAIKQLKAFVAGANHYIKTGPKTLEQRLLRYDIKPFEPQEALAVAGYMSLSFAQGMISDALMTDLLDEVPFSEVELMFHNYVIDPKQAALNYSPSQDFYQKTVSNLQDLANTITLFHGSNAFALSSKRSMSSRPLLENDPHIAVSNPSIWYEAHVKTPDFELYGHYIPLAPFAGLGHNHKKAWGITMSEIDDLDLYQETFHPTKPNLVLFKGQYVPVKNIVETIEIKGEESFKLQVTETPHGPILDDIKALNGRKGVALKWAYHHPKNDIVSTLYALNHAQGLEDIPQSLSHATSPAFAITFVDHKDNIGVHYMGIVAQRPKHISGKQILDGASGKDEYLGYLQTKQNPHLYNPPSGVIVSANHEPLQQGNWQGYWQYAGRQKRLETLLSLREKWDLPSLKKVATDIGSPYPVSTLKKITTLIKATTKQEQRGLEILTTWKHLSKKEDAATAIYYALFGEIMRQMLEDELGRERMMSYTRLASSFYFFGHALDHPHLTLWDDKKTTHKETMQDIINRSFRITLKKLTERLGPHMKTWTWGDLHHITFKHAMGQFFPLDKLLNLGPYPIYSANSHINNMCYRVGDETYDVTIAPSTRRLIDMKSPQESWGILPTGNSGHRFSAHYKDQVQDYLNNKFRKQMMSLEAVKKAPHQHMKLVP